MTEVRNEQKPAQPLPWHADIWAQWSQQLHDDRLPHALLITGLPGLGKRTLARALAHRLLCEAPQGPHACGHCEACQMMAAGFHPDWHQLSPEAEGKALKIDQIREMTLQVQQSAQRGGHKLVLIWPAEAMNLYAANALLKTLEEPEPRTQFVLVSDQPSSLPATLRSRCQHWKVQPPPLSQGQDWLAHQLSEDQCPQQLLKAAGGRPLQALKMARPEQEQQRQLLYEALDRLTRDAEVTEVASQLKSLPLADCLDSLQNWLADSLRYTLFAEAGVQDVRQLPLYQQWHALMSVRQRIKLDLDCRQARLGLKQNPNPELFIENLLISLTKELGHE